MYLYSLTLQQATGIHLAIFGNFSSSSSQELAISRVKVLEIYRVGEQGELEILVREEVFGLIRSMIAFRLTGSSTDLLIIGSDSGKISVIELQGSRLVTLHQETFGKTGCRRIVPGQYLASDPKGRAVLIGAVEKQKFVYMLNKNASNQIMISSPLEAHKARTVLLDVVGVDVGYENPLFACLETDYGDPSIPTSPVCIGQPTIMLILYEMDLGLNHVVRKSSTEVSVTSHKLIPVPGGTDGPGGILVCDEHKINYYQETSLQYQCRYPRRADMSDGLGTFITSWASHKQRDSFFFLIQSESGDIFKVSISSSSLKVQYFETIQPCVSLCIVKTGFLFGASESGDHTIHQFLSVGEETEEAAQVSGDDTPLYFMPRPLQHLNSISEIKSLAPITDMRVADLTGEGVPQVYALCGKGPRSTLRVLRFGLGVTELGSSPLNSKPIGIWAVGSIEHKSPLTKYIAISYYNATLVLEMGETISDASNHGFDLTSSSIHVSLLENMCYLQVTPTGMRIISTHSNDDWASPGRIRAAASNPRQVAISMQGGKIIYYELDSTGRLQEIEKKEMEQEVTCIDICPIPAGRVRGRFLAVGCYDNTVKILSLDPEGCLRRLSTQIMPNSRPYSVKFAEQVTGNETELFINVGLESGIYLRTVVDGITGQISDTRSRYLGGKPVNLFRTNINGAQALFASSVRSFVSYTYMDRYMTVPLVYDSLDVVTSFCSEACPEGHIGMAGNVLKFFMLENLGDNFNQTTLPLYYTPKKMEVFENSLFIVESDHNAFTHEEREELRGSIKFSMEEMSEAMIGTPQAGEGRWACMIRHLDPMTLATRSQLILSNNETAVSLCITSFSREESFLVVGTVANLQLTPRSHTGSYISVYKINKEDLEFVHKTEVEDIALAMCGFKGGILIGVGNLLRIYELGQRQLLKKNRE